MAVSSYKEYKKLIIERINQKYLSYQIKKFNRPKKSMGKGKKGIFVLLDEEDE